MDLDMPFACRWIMALESDQFKQGQGRLAREHEQEVRYCCLGVACELAHREGNLLRDRDETGSYRYRYTSTDTWSDALLPTVLKTSLGFADMRGDIHGMGDNYLSSMNDGLGFTFLQIADVLRWKYGLPNRESTPDLTDWAA